MTSSARIDVGRGQNTPSVLFFQFNYYNFRTRACSFSIRLPTWTVQLVEINDDFHKLPSARKICMQKHKIPIIMSSSIPSHCAIQMKCDWILFTCSMAFVHCTVATNFFSEKLSFIQRFSFLYYSENVCAFGVYFFTFRIGIGR